LAASDSLILQAPSGQGDCWDRGRPDTCHSLLDSQFVSIDVTNQVNWILSHDGQFAIVFLVEPNVQGGTGKIAAYAWESAPGFDKIGMPSDNPWSRDGNSTHLVVESNDLHIVGVEGQKARGYLADIFVQSTPNPFDSRTTITYGMEGKNSALIRIYGVNGRRVFERRVSGSGRMEWRAEGMPAGVYLLKAETGGRSIARRIVKLK
jgi:hypothetical protein